MFPAARWSSGRTWGQSSFRIIQYFSRPVSKDTNQTEKNTGNSDSSEKQTNMSSHLILHKAETSSESVSKPLVLLFQWLYAKPSTVKKYCTLYNDIGLDVLAVRGKLSHFLWPPEGTKLSSELFAYLESNRPAEEKLLVHAFSVGAYNYTIAMKAALKHPEKCGNFRDKVMGQIFDSIVIGTYENMSQGIAEVLPNNKAFRRLVLQTLNLYYQITHKTTKETYSDLVQHFKEEPIQVPALFFYSHNDPMCDSAAMETMLNEWRSGKPDFDVTSVSWPESVHSAHLREHREEYMAAWKGLMEKLQIM